MYEGVIKHTLLNVFQRIKGGTLRIVLLMVCLSYMQAHAQLSKEGKAPEEVIVAFKERYFPLEVVTWEWDSKILNYRAHFHEDAREYTAYFDTFGKWVKTKTIIREKELPEEIKFNLGNSSFNDWEIKSIEEESNKEDGTVYRMEITSPHTNEHKQGRIIFLTFLPDGLLLNMERKL